MACVQQCAIRIKVGDHVGMSRNAAELCEAEVGLADAEGRYTSLDDMSKLVRVMQYSLDSLVTKNERTERPRSLFSTLQVLEINRFFKSLNFIITKVVPRLHLKGPSTGRSLCQISGPINYSVAEAFRVLEEVASLPIMHQRIHMELYWTKKQVSLSDRASITVI